MKGFNFRYFNLTKKEEEKKPHTTHTMKKSRSMMTDFLKHWPLSPGADVAQHSESMFLLQLKASFAAVCIWYWGETVQNTYQRTARQFPSIYYNQNPTNVGFLRTIPRAISNDLKNKKKKEKICKISTDILFFLSDTQSINTYAKHLLLKLLMSH